MKLNSNSKRELLYAIAALIPLLILFVTFTYYPLFKALLYSFTDWDGFSRNYNYIGFDNFFQIFRIPEINISFYNTFYYAVIAIIIGTIFEFLTALLLFENFKGRGTIKALLFAPSVISCVIVSYMWTDFFSYVGVVNKFIEMIGVKGAVIDWLGDPNVVKNVLVFINTWQGTGYGMVIILAGLASIPKEVTEAALVEGAVSFKKFRYITLPMIMPSITILLFLGITGLLKVFDMPFIMTKGGPLNSSKMVSMVIYDYAFNYRQFGTAGAIGVVFFILIAVISVIQLNFTRKREVEG
jgi:raffinose/stachyose/melibiose transport system permease protein